MRRSALQSLPVASLSGFLVFAVALTLPGRERSRNPYKGSARDTSEGALFTTEKQKPDKAERKAVFEDFRIPRSQWKGYVAEYRVPISLGGSNAYANIEALTKQDARLKRRVRDDLEKRVRRGELRLEEAQMKILNWRNDPVAVGKHPSGQH
jgi:hypothetical protein